MKHLLLGLLLSTFTLPASAQEKATPGALRLFLDCEHYLCDFDFFRTEINFVDYVRDRQDADVHVLVTTQNTGGGGTAFNLNFIGLQRFAGVADTLAYASGATDTEAEVRAGLARVLKAGLVRYLTRTSALDRLRISYDTLKTNVSATTQAEEDPWNYWVFRTSVNGWGHGEDRFKSTNAYGSVRATRVTEDWKVRTSLNGSRRAQTFELSDGTRTEDVQKSFGASGLVVKSLNPHWSAGITADIDHSTHANFDLAFKAAPAIEFNVFPYSESTRKLLTVRYALGPAYYDYADTTIFNKTEDLLFRQSLSTSLTLKQPWGSVSLSVNGASYLHDLEKLSLNTGGDVDLRLFRGFSVNLGGYVSLVRDQLNIAKGDATDEDVLLRRRELATDYRFFFNFGVSYTFGSKFNNVVNPRFDGGGGGGHVVFF